MANIIERFFESKAEMNTALSDTLASALAEGITQRNEAVLMVSGGSSPAPAYRYLSGLDFAWDKVSIAMVDERWVALDHPKSNEQFIQQTLLQDKAKQAKFVAMKNSEASAVEGQEACEAAYQKLPTPADVTILGMGPDGHTASLFPHAQGLKEALETEALTCAISAIQSEVTGDITERMSLTLHGIAQSKTVILLISGEEKRAVYEQAKQAGSVFEMPLRAVLNHPTLSLQVFWAP